MNSSIVKKMTLLAEWKDHGLSSGMDNAKKRTDTLKKAAKELTLALAAMVGAISGLVAAMMAFTKRGAEVESVTESFMGFVKSANLGAGALEQIRETVRGSLSDMDLMRASTQALAAGLQPERLLEFWAKAKQMSDVMSRPVIEMFEGLTRAVNKQQVESLETIGITLRTEQVYDDYAKSIQKSSGAALNAAERTAAFSSALEGAYVKNFHNVGNVTTKSYEAFNQLEAKIKNLKDRFSLMIAQSPYVQKFIEDLITGIDDVGKKLEENGPAITEATGKLVEFWGIIQKVAGGLWKARDWIVNLAAALAAGKIAIWISGIVAAMGGLQISAVAVGGWVGLIVGGLLTLGNYWREVSVSILEVVDTLNRVLAGVLGSAVEAFRRFLEVASQAPLIGSLFKNMLPGVQEAEAFFREQVFGKTAIDTLQEKIMGLPKFNLLGILFPKGEQKLPGEGGPAGAGPGTSDLWDQKVQAEKQRAASADKELSDFYASKGIMGPPQPPESTPPEPILPEGKAKIKLVEESAKDEREIRSSEAEGMTDYLIMLEEGRKGHYLESWAEEAFEWKRDLEDRKQAYAAAYSGMGQYSDKFFKHGANMGRVLNAMLIRGMAEMAASYIDSKTKQARFDALEYAYKAVASMAEGNWGAAGGYGIAAAKAAAIAGVGALTAGAIRAWGQEKADALTAEGEKEQADAERQQELEGQRRQATGVVKTRPMNINIYSSHSINAGVVLFGDSKEAVDEFYEDYFRPAINEDIETGMIAV